MLQGKLCQAVALHLQVLHQHSRACSCICSLDQVRSGQKIFEALCIMRESAETSLRIHHKVALVSL